MTTKNLLFTSVAAACAISFATTGLCDDSASRYGTSSSRMHRSRSNDVSSNQQSRNGNSGNADNYSPTSNQATTPERSRAEGTTNDNNNQLSRRDREFVTDAAQGNVAEVENARTALNTSHNDGIQRFSQRLSEDHSKANDELRQLAANKGLNLPSYPSTDQKRAMDRMSKMSGNDFDKAYISHMVKDHREDISKYENAAKNAKDPEVRAYAEKQLPILREHLDMARNLESSAGNMNTSKNQ